MTPQSKIIITFASLLTAASANAAGAPEVSTPSTEARKICLRDSVTGSRIERTKCLTVGEWRAQLSPEEFERLRKLAGIPHNSDFASGSYLTKDFALGEGPIH